MTIHYCNETRTSSSYTWRIRGIGLAIAMLSCCDLPALPQAQADRRAARPTPVVEMTFDQGYGNAGSGGGTAEVEVYGEGEAPYLMPGPWRDCVDLSQVSRFGGTLDQREPAGSALIYRNRALDAQTNFTVVLWVRGAADVPETSSRLLTKVDAWELLYSGGRPTFLVVREGEKTGYRCPALPSGDTRDWMFVAGAVDGDAGAVSLYVGALDAGLEGPLSTELTRVPSQCQSPLQIGNFNGIRPFKGWMDNLRIYDAALATPQIRELFDGDLAGWSSGRWLQTWAVVEIRPADR